MSMQAKIFKTFQHMWDTPWSNLSSLLIWEEALTNIDNMWSIIWFLNVSHTENDYPTCKDKDYKFIA